MNWWTLAIGLLLVACGRGPQSGDDVLPTEAPPRLEIATPDLPLGIVGEAYVAAITATGGRPPLTFDVDPDLPLPLGLTLEADGTISGIPVEAGPKEVLVVVSDFAGQQSRVIAPIEIDLVPHLLNCGDTLEGRFTRSAFNPSGPDWRAVTTESLQWLGIPWPQGETQQVQIRVEADTTVGLLVQRPNQPEGSLDWREDYIGTYVGEDSGTVVTLNPGTTPSLPNFEAQGLVPILMVAFSEGDYRLSVSCSDGPVFRQTLPLPVRLGDEFTIDYDVYGDNTDVTFTFQGELPEWVDVDEVEGTLSGTASEEVTVPLVVTATDGGGRSRSAASILGVFDPKPITCGETASFTLEEGYYDGAIAGFYDPRGYRVYELTVPSDISAVSWTLDGLDGQFLGLVNHYEERFLYFGGADTEFSASGPVRLDVTPRTYPATRHYRDVGTMYVVAATTGLGRDLELTPNCDSGPRPNLAGLPVVQPLVDVDEALPGIGGVAPFVFQATGLPPGLSIQGARLVGSSTAIGRHTVDLTVTDALAETFTDRYDLYVGLDEACDGGLRIECDDVLTGTFGGTFFQDPTAQAEERLCFYAEGTPAVGFEFSSDGGEFRVDLGDPGVRGSLFLDDPDLTTQAGVVFDDDTEAVAMNPFSWPALPDYDGLPVHLALRALEPGDWQVVVQCDEPLP